GADAQRGAEPAAHQAALRRAGIGRRMAPGGGRAGDARPLRRAPRARRPGPGDGVIGMAQPISQGSETREQWLGRAIEMMRLEFAAAGAPLPENLAVSCSWPSGNPRTVIGECWVAERHGSPLTKARTLCI